MRHSTILLSLIAILIMGMISLGTAQMMNGKEHQSMMQNNSNAQVNTNGMGVMGMVSQMNNMMGNMSQNFQKFSRDYDELQTNFDQMMQSNNLDSLKSEMKNQAKMMEKVHEVMSKQNKMWQQMMKFMNANQTQEE